MLITIISIIITVVLYIVLKKTCFRNDEDFCGWGFIILLSMLLSIVLHLLSYPIKLERPSVVTTQKIVASKPNSNISGDIKAGLFFTRCKIDEVDYYVYLTESKGVYKQDRVQVDNTVIVETTRTPRVVRRFNYVNNGLSWKIRFHSKPKELTGERDTIFVPAGTVSECSSFEIF